MAANATRRGTLYQGQTFDATRGRPQHWKLCKASAQTAGYVEPDPLLLKRSFAMSKVHDVMPAAKTILAVDLGKFKSVACVLDVAAGPSEKARTLRGG